MSKKSKQARKHAQEQRDAARADRKQKAAIRTRETKKALSTVKKKAAGAEQLTSKPRRAAAPRVTVVQTEAQSSAILAADGQPVGQVSQAAVLQDAMMQQATLERGAVKLAGGLGPATLPPGHGVPASLWQRLWGKKVTHLLGSLDEKPQGSLPMNLDELSRSTEAITAAAEGLLDDALKSQSPDAILSLSGAEAASQMADVVDKNAKVVGQTPVRIYDPRETSQYEAQTDDGVTYDNVQSHYEDGPALYGDHAGEFEADEYAAKAEGMLGKASRPRNPAGHAPQVNGPSVQSLSEGSDEGQAVLALPYQPLLSDAVLNGEIAVCCSPGYKFPAISGAARERQLQLGCMIPGFFQAWQSKPFPKHESYRSTRSVYEERQKTRATTAAEHSRRREEKAADTRALVDAAKEFGVRWGWDMSRMILNPQDFLKGGEAKLWANVQKSLSGNSRQSAFRAGPAHELFMFLFNAKRMDGHVPSFCTNPLDDAPEPAEAIAEPTVVKNFRAGK